MNLRLFLLPAFVCLANGCISVKIDSGDSYSKLLPEQQSHIKKFVPGQALHDTTDNFTLYELMPGALRKELENADYTCVFSQTPHCHGAHCKPLTYYSRLLASLDSMHVQTLLVSPYYEYALMQQEKERFRYDGLMCVIDKDTYGNHKFKGQKLFMDQVLGRKLSSKDGLGFAHYYVFRGDSLMAYGLEQADAVNYIREHRL